ncbi:MAG TPA: hypothetical protein VH640_16410 [Bryobacteraceae bacterium]|jgi:hypothetical protein
MKNLSKMLLLLTGAAGALLAGDQAPAPKKSGINLLAKINVPNDSEESVVALPNLLDTTTTEYAFGRTISRHALAFQVHVDNTSKDYQLLVHDIGSEICKRDDAPPRDSGKKGTAPQMELRSRPEGSFCPDGPFTTMSSMDKYVMQGLADRGQSQDPRNMALRVITGIGLAATPLPTVVVHLGHSFTPAAAWWSGPVVEACKAIFPDYTVNQLVRLNNSSFQTDKVVPKNSSADMTVFFPTELLLNKEQIKEFRHDPYRLFSDAVRNYRIVVDGQFITPAPNKTQAQGAAQ